MIKQCHYYSDGTDQLDNSHHPLPPFFSTSSFVLFQLSSYFFVRIIIIVHLTSSFVFYCIICLTSSIVVGTYFILYPYYVFRLTSFFLLNFISYSILDFYLFFFILIHRILLISSTHLQPDVCLIYSKMLCRLLIIIIVRRIFRTIFSFFFVLFHFSFILYFH